eukprot:COSAG05_NODE_7722_length_776_cov_1.279173_1_plen_48_part_10
MHASDAPTTKVLKSWLRFSYPAVVEIRHMSAAYAHSSAWRTPIPWSYA